MIVPGGGFIPNMQAPAAPPYACTNTVSSNYCRYLDGAGAGNATIGNESKAQYETGGAGFKVYFGIDVGVRRLWFRADPESYPSETTGVSIGVDGATMTCLQADSTYCEDLDTYAVLTGNLEIAYPGGIPGGYDYAVTHGGQTYYGMFSNVTRNCFV